MWLLLKCAMYSTLTHSLTLYHKPQHYTTQTCDLHERFPACILSAECSVHPPWCPSSHGLDQSPHPHVTFSVCRPSSPSRWNLPGPHLPGGTLCRSRPCSRPSLESSAATLFQYRRPSRLHRPLWLHWCQRLMTIPLHSLNIRTSSNTVNEWADS